MPETAQFVIQNNAYKTLQSFAKSDGQSTDWVGNSESHEWSDEIDWWIKSGIPTPLASNDPDEVKAAREKLKDLNPHEVAEMINYLSDLRRIAKAIRFQNQCETENAERLEAWRMFQDQGTLP